MSSPSLWELALLALLTMLPLLAILFMVLRLAMGHPPVQASPEDHGQRTGG